MELEKVTLKLRKGDFARLRECYPEAGASKVVRLMVANFVDSLAVHAPNLTGQLEKMED